VSDEKKDNPWLAQVIPITKNDLISYEELKERLAKQAEPQPMVVSRNQWYDYWELLHGKKHPDRK
jgi:hypothetical protein